MQGIMIGHNSGMRTFEHISFWIIKGKSCRWVKPESGKLMWLYN